MKSVPRATNHRTRSPAWGGRATRLLKRLLLLLVVSSFASWAQTPVREELPAFDFEAARKRDRAFAQKEEFVARLRDYLEKDLTDPALVEETFRFKWQERIVRPDLAIKSHSASTPNDEFLSVILDRRASEDRVPSGLLLTLNTTFVDDKNLNPYCVSPKMIAIRLVDAGWQFSRQTSRTNRSVSYHFNLAKITKSGYIVSVTLSDHYDDYRCNPNISINFTTLER